MVWINEYTLWFPPVSKNLLSQENSLIGLQIRYLPFRNVNLLVHMMVDNKFLDYTLHALFDDEKFDEEKNEHQIWQQGLNGM